MTLGRGSYASHGDHVAGAHLSDVRRAKSDERLGLPGRGHELDLDAIRLVDLDDGPKIPRLEAMLGDVVGEGNALERLEIHHEPSGYRVTRRGSWSPRRMIQI